MDPITVFLVALAVAVAVALAHVTVRIRAAIKAWRLRMSLAVPIALAVVLAWWAFGVPLPWQIPTVAAALVAFIAWRRWGRVAARVTRWGERERRKSGVASTLDVARTASTLAMRCTAKNVRPSLASMSFWERMRVETAAFAVQLARIGRLWAWASIEDIVFVFGGPRTGKSGWLGGRVLDAPGAAIVSSTRTDLLELTSPHRAKKGPVLVFNATDEATIESTITFDPLMGCDNPVVALQRANDLLSVSPDTGGGGDRQYWID